MNQPVLSTPVRNAIEIAVYLLLIFGIVAWCLQILAPFLSFLLWGIIIAVSVYKPFLKLRGILGGRNKLAVTLFVVLGLAIIVVPTWLFAGSLVGSAHDFRENLQAGQVHIPQASERVRDWPVVGAKLYTNWSQAAQNFEGWLNAHSEQVRTVADTIVHKVTGIGLAVLQFVAATLIAALFLAHAEASRAMVARFCRRLAGDQGDDMLTLTTATIRSVTVGVLGIAFIQAVLGGLGMVAVGVPGAGVWTLLILVLAIAQLPPWLVLFPVIFYVFSTHDSAAVSTMFAVWSIIVSFLDMVLKPMMLGRGVAAPMPVILLGAIGGLVHSGIIGLFVGAVILAIGYKLFVAWMEAGRPNADAAEG